MFYHFLSANYAWSRIYVIDATYVTCMPFVPSLYWLRYRFDMLMNENVTALNRLWKTLGQCTVVVNSTIRSSLSVYCCWSLGWSRSSSISTEPVVHKTLSVGRIKSYMGHCHKDFFEQYFPTCAWVSKVSFPSRMSAEVLCAFLMSRRCGICLFPYACHASRVPDLTDIYTSKTD